MVWKEVGARRRKISSSEQSCSEAARARPADLTHRSESKLDALDTMDSSIPIRKARVHSDPGPRGSMPRMPFGASLITIAGIEAAGPSRCGSAPVTVPCCSCAYSMKCSSLLSCLLDSCFFACLLSLVLVSCARPSTALGHGSTVCRAQCSSVACAVVRSTSVLPILILISRRLSSQTPNPQVKNPLWRGRAVALSSERCKRGAQRLVTGGERPQRR